MELVLPDVSGWSLRFEREAAAIRDSLGPGPAIEHIGSTAVGIESKDVVDVLVGVRPDAHASVVAQLGDKGFVVEGTRTTAEGERHSWLTRLVEEQRVTVVHVVVVAGAEWRRRTTFRDALQRDDALRAAYVALKREAADLTDDWSEYTARKSTFVQRVTDGQALTRHDMNG